jgi:hypothetical protein
LIEKLKHGKANWDAVAHRVSLDMCIEEVNKYNCPVHVLNANDHNNLVTNFNNRTKRNYDRKQMKNRWDILKKVTLFGDSNDDILTSWIRA